MNISKHNIFFLYASIFILCNRQKKASMSLTVFGFKNIFVDFNIYSYIKFCIDTVLSLQRVLFHTVRV